MRSVAATVSVCQQKGVHVFMSVCVVCQPAPERPTDQGWVCELVSARSLVPDGVAHPGCLRPYTWFWPETTQETWADNRVPDPG